GALLMIALWVTVIIFREKARWVGGGWMVFGLVAYVVYRKVVEGTTLTKRISVPEEALRKEVPEAEYASILVPVFGTELDEGIVRARNVGAGIVEEARRRGVELIVMGGEPPTRVRGGAVLGGIGGSRPPEVGPVTEYVLRKAPCRVLLTAPPESGASTSTAAA